MAPLTLHIFRHGETHANASGSVSGDEDTLFTQRGEQQAREVHTQLDAEYQLALCSSLPRSIRTLSLVLASGVHVGEAGTDWRLKERSLGEWAGKPRRHVPEYASGDLHFAPPGGESYAEVARRLFGLLMDLRYWATLTQVVSDSPCQILISTHAGPMRILAGILEGEADTKAMLSRDFKNCEVYRGQLKSLEDTPAWLTKIVKDDERKVRCTNENKSKIRR